MSRFLGKIHYIMFDKINYVDEIARKMSELLDDNVDLKNIERGALEDLIDTDNIHGWLQVRVGIVEDNLARVLSELKKEEKLEGALKIAYDFGAKEDFSGDASDAFQFMSDKFLDGMPCDMANLPVESITESSVGLRELMCTNSITSMENLLKFTMNFVVRGWMVCWVIVIWNTSWKMELIL